MVFIGFETIGIKDLKMTKQGQMPGLLQTLAK